MACMKTVALHRLLGIHGVQARRVEAGQPRTAGRLTLAQDHEAEWVFGALVPVRQLAALVLASDVRLQIGAGGGAAGHHHFHHAGYALLVVGVVVVLGAG